MKDRMTYRLDRRGKLLKQCIREMYGFNSPSDDDIDRDAFADWDPQDMDI